MNVTVPQNRTGLYPGYGMYPPHPVERRTTIPRMLYRGHAIRIGRGDEDSYYQQHQVNRYQMHSLNAGFSGKDRIPRKDQNSYKVPFQRLFCARTPSGKWTNYPMTVEIGKYTRGNGSRQLSTPLPGGIKQLSTPLPEATRRNRNSIVSIPARSRTSFSFRGSVDLPSRPLPSPLDFVSDTRLYEELQPEIIDIMAARNEVFLSFQNRVESALMNDRDPISNPPSRLGFAGNNEMLPSLKPLNQRTRPKTSFFYEDPNTNLLLPVPFVMPNSRLPQHPMKLRSNSAPVVMK